MVTGWLACSLRDEASLWLGKRGTTDSDQWKVTASQLKACLYPQIREDWPWQQAKRLISGSDWQVDEIDKWKRLTEIEIYTKSLFAFRSCKLLYVGSLQEQGVCSRNLAVVNFDLQEQGVCSQNLVVVNFDLQEQGSCSRTYYLVSQETLEFKPARHLT